MNLFTKISILFYFFFISSSSYSYVVRNNFSIINHCKSPITISYYSCIRKEWDREVTYSCDDHSREISSGESITINVDSNDNYWKDKEHYLRREIYLYQATSQQSLGLFLRGHEDTYNYDKAYTRV